MTDGPEATRALREVCERHLGPDGAGRLAAALDDVRAADGWPAEREEALVARVLARTTREDLSWRGEWRLVGDFLRERFARSRAWRLVAASVLAHVLALPALAWYVWKDVRRPRVVHLEFDTPRAPSFAEPEEETIAVEVPALRDDPFESAAATPGGDAVWNARRRDRFALQRARVPEAPGEAAPASPEMTWLAARSRGLHGGAWDQRLDDTERLDRAGLGDLALRAEVLLDRFVLGAPSEQAPGALADVLAELSLRRVDAERAALVALVLDRARSYGLWPAPPRFDPLAGPPAPDPRVVELALDAGSPALADEPLARLWRAWAAQAARD